MHIQIDLNKKTTGFFTANYGRDPEDWNNQDVLNGLGWHQKKNVYYPNEQGVFDNETLQDVREMLRKHVTTDMGYIYQAFLVRDDGSKVPICPPLTSKHSSSEKIRGLVFTNLRPPEPEYVAGEEEEEFLLYRSAP